MGRRDQQPLFDPDKVSQKVEDQPRKKKLDVRRFVARLQATSWICGCGLTGKGINCDTHFWRSERQHLEFLLEEAVPVAAPRGSACGLAVPCTPLLLWLYGIFLIYDYLARTDVRPPPFPAKGWRSCRSQSSALRSA